MSLQTNSELDLTTINELPARACTVIRNFFALPEIEHTEKISAGWANATFLLKTVRGDYFARFLLCQKAEQIPNDLAIQAQLQSSSLKTATYLLSTTQELILKLNNYPVVVSGRVPGEMPETITPKLVSSLGHTLATFHRAVRSLPIEHQGWLNQRAVAQSQSNTSGVLRQRVEHLAAAQEQIQWDRLPRGIIHGDLGPSNTLCEQEQVTGVLDFEESEANIFLVDIAATLLVCLRHKEAHDTEKSLVDSLLQGYQGIRPLTPLEKEQFPIVLRYTAAATALWFMARDFLPSAHATLTLGESIFGMSFRR